MPQTVPDSVDTAKSKPGRGPGLHGSCVAPRRRGCCQRADQAQEGSLGKGTAVLPWSGPGEFQELGGEMGRDNQDSNTRREILATNKNIQVAWRAERRIACGLNRVEGSSGR